MTLSFDLQDEDLVDQEQWKQGVQRHQGSHGVPLVV